MSEFYMTFWNTVSVPSS